jgi:hypothetical protein
MADYSYHGKMNKPTRSDLEAELGLSGLTLMVFCFAAIRHGVI